MEVIIAVEWIATLAWIYWLFHDRWPLSGSHEVTY